MGIYEHSCIQHEFPRIIHKFNQKLLPTLIYSLRDFCKRSLLFLYCKRKVFFVYRLALDAKPDRVDDVAG